MGAVGVEHLKVGVDGDEIDSLDPGLDHPVEGVAAPPADADDPDLGAAGILDELELQFAGSLASHDSLLFFREHVLDFGP